MTTAEFGKALAAQLERERPIHENLITKWEQGYQVPGADVYLGVLDLAGLSADIATVSDGTLPLPRTLDPASARMFREVSELRGLVQSLAEGRLRKLPLPLAEGPDEDYVGMKEAAELLSTSRATVYNRLASGALAAYRLGSETVVRRQDVLKLRERSAER